MFIVGYQPSMWAPTLTPACGNRQITQSSTFFSQILVKLLMILHRYGDYYGRSNSIK